MSTETSVSFEGSKIFDSSSDTDLSTGNFKSDDKQVSELYSPSTPRTANAFKPKQTPGSTAKKRKRELEEKAAKFDEFLLKCTNLTRDNKKLQRDLDTSRKSLNKETSAHKRTRAKRDEFKDENVKLKQRIVKLEEEKDTALMTLTQPISTREFAVELGRNLCSLVLEDYIYHKSMPKHKGEDPPQLFEIPKELYDRKYAIEKGLCAEQKGQNNWKWDCLVARVAKPRLKLHMIPFLITMLSKLKDPGSKMVHMMYPGCLDAAFMAVQNATPDAEHDMKNAGLKTDDTSFFHNLVIREAKKVRNKFQN